MLAGSGVPRTDHGFKPQAAVSQASICVHGLTKHPVVVRGLVDLVEVPADGPALRLGGVGPARPLVDELATGNDPELRRPRRRQKG
jgi:hypothetical protein